VLKEGEVHVWRVRLDDSPRGWFPAPTAGEAARAAHFRSPAARRRYLRSHGALRAILAAATSAPLDFAVTEKGKPYLPGAPELRFSLSRSQGMALVGAALEVDVGVDVERLRPMPDCAAIAARFLPPSEAAALQDMPAAARGRDFFRRWTRIEAMLKASGAGLHGAGFEIPGEWTVREIDVGEEFAGAAAAPKDGMRVVIHDFGGADDRFLSSAILDL
jgi:4'-phosphopantetheinyl transferase